MAQLRSNERPIIEFELSTSTPEDKKWIKAYGRTELSDIGLMLYEAQQLEDEDESKLPYIVMARLIIDWSWYAGEEKAAITPENVALLDPIDFIEISTKTDVNQVLERLMKLMPETSKKKSSSATSSTKPKRKKAKR